MCLNQRVDGLKHLHWIQAHLQREPIRAKGFIFFYIKFVLIGSISEQELRGRTFYQIFRIWKDNVLSVASGEYQENLAIKSPT